MKSILQMMTDLKDEIYVRPTEKNIAFKWTHALVKHENESVSGTNYKEKLLF